MLYAHPAWDAVARRAIGGFFVAVFIALEVTFSRRSASAEHKIRDWYAVRVAELDLARAEIEERLQPRRLSIEQQRAMADALRRFKGNIRPIIVGTTDAESIRLAKQIIAVLRLAGLDVFDASGNLAHIASQESGIKIVRYHSEDEDLFVALGDALTSGGLRPVELVRAPEQTWTGKKDEKPPWFSSIRLLVQPKPIPIIQDIPVIQEYNHTARLSSMVTRLDTTRMK